MAEQFAHEADSAQPLPERQREHERRVDPPQAGGDHIWIISAYRSIHLAQ